MLDYFENEIDIRENITYNTKNRYRYTFKRYYSYVKERKELVEGVLFINPVPSSNLFNFTEKVLPIESLETEDELLTYPVVEKILNYLFVTRRKIFIILSLLLYSGARISEVCSIEIKNIDLEERFFYTKIKSKKNQNRWGIYFFPSFFISYLEQWITEIK
ncbi:MAG: tyrosine-type recombinase/integrase [Promethearchaeota archaeon]